MPEDPEMQKTVSSFFPAICPKCGYDDPARPAPDICPMCGYEKEVRTIG